MKWKSIWLLIVLIGLVTRIFLVFKLPIWIDERDSISYIQLPITTLLSGTINVTHPPGYFLLLEAWSFIFHTTAIIALRVSTLVFFLLNCLLIYKLGARYLTNKFGMSALLSYSLSGYSVIFDWQIRPYTGLVTLILLSLYLLTFSKSKTAVVLFSIVNFVGLFFDYGFVWYIGSLLVVLSLSAIIPKFRTLFERENMFLASLIGSVVTYALIWLPHGNLHGGLEGMDWIRFYSGPDFFIPFFLGAAHQRMLLVGIMFLLFMVGCVVFIRKNHSFKHVLPVLLAGISLVSAFCLNAFVPILHVRNLQIVGIGVIFICAILFYWLTEKKNYVLFIVVLWFYTLNFLFIIQTHFLEPGRLLVKFLY